MCHVECVRVSPTNAIVTKRDTPTPVRVFMFVHLRVRVSMRARVCVGGNGPHKKITNHNQR